jgi:hypothetical protein
MNKKLLNAKEHTPACAYCLHGRLSPDKRSILCVKRGVVALDYACRRYEYDPLKRQPRRAPTLPTFSPEDFEL